MTGVFPIIYCDTSTSVCEFPQQELSPVTASDDMVTVTIHTNIYANFYIGKWDINGTPEVPIVLHPVSALMRLTAVLMPDDLDRFCPLTEL